MTKRKYISKKIRFEIFNRDGFTCHYCGAHPPESILQIDHIIPVSKGGTNDPENLITSCQSCNIGKGANLLDKTELKIDEKIKDIEESEEQIKQYNEVIQRRNQRIKNESWAIAELLFSGSKEKGIEGDFFNSIRKFISMIGFAECADAVEITDTFIFKKRADKFKYFCGVCWKKYKGEYNG